MAVRIFSPNVGGFPGGALGPLSVATTCPMPAGTVGVAYASALAAAGGLPPYTFAISAGALPPGLTLVGGLISGTPIGPAGTAAFTIQVTDSAAMVKTKSCTIVISDFSFSESFQRADQPFYAGTNWDAVIDPAAASGISGTQLASCLNVTGTNQLHVTNSTGAGTFPLVFLVPRLTANISGLNQYSLCTNVNSNSAGGTTARFGPSVLQDSNGATCYVVEFLHDLGDQWILRRRINGTDVSIIAPNAGNICSFGQSLKLRVAIAAGVPTLTVSVNGTDQASAADNSGLQLITGIPGLYCEGNSNGIFQDINLYQCGSGVGP